MALTIIRPVTKCYYTKFAELLSSEIWIKIAEINTCCFGIEFIDCDRIKNYTFKTHSIFEFIDRSI